MKILANINTEKVISLDIETVRLYKDYKDVPENIKAAWYYDRKWKDENRLEENTEEDLARLWETEASFKPEFSKICAISLVFQSKGVLRCKEFVSEDEILLLMEFADTVSKFAQDFTYVAHAGYYFDYPFIAMRFLYNGLPIPSIFDESGAQPWTKRLLDTNYIRKSFGTSPGGSLLSLCTAFGIPFSKSEISGSDVGEKYFAGKLTEISAYCSLDTIAGYNLLRAMKGESIFNPETVVYVNKGEVLTMDPVITEIKNKGKLSPVIRKKLLETSKTLSLSEKQNLCLLIKAALGKKDQDLSPDELEFIESVAK